MKNQFNLLLLAALLLLPIGLRAQTWTMDSDELRQIHDHIELARLSAPAPQDTSPANPTQILTNFAASQTTSFSNATFEIDAGVLTLNIGGTSQVDSFLRGSYNWQPNFFTSGELQLGNGNVLDGLVLVPAGLRKATAATELYGAIGVKLDGTGRNADGSVKYAGKAVIEFGGKWMAVQSLTGTTNSFLSNLAVGAEARGEIGFDSASLQKQQSLGIIGMATYPF
jgi:hypothetical protein